MSNAALAVGVSITATFIIVVVGVVALVCVLNKRNPRRRAGGQKKVLVRNVKKGTESIKRKAEKLKADSSSSCCVLMACCSGSRSDGPFPDPPFGVELQDPTASEITILWNPPETESQVVAIQGYCIYKRLKMNSDWTKVGKVTTEELEFRITGLVPNKRYVFGVSSKAKTGESTVVETQPTVLKKDPVRPGAPAELDVSDKGSTSVTLSWKPPRKGGNCRINTYYIMIKDCERSHADWTHLTALPAFDRFMDYKVTGLKPKHQYKFRVNAENVVGLGPYAETMTQETTDIEPDPPGKAKGPIKYARISHSSITLSWRPPDQNGGKPISGYAVEFKEKETPIWSKAGVCEADKTRLTVSKLQEDIEYVFRVIAMNVVGNSKPLVGRKVKTRLLEIPLSRRSSFRLPSRAETSRDSARGKQSARDALSRELNPAPTDLDGNALHSQLEGLDPQLEADPFVPKSDFFSYDETSSGNVSNRHSENKTKHSQFSPLPAPPRTNAKKRSGAPDIGPKHIHSDISPLPKPQSRQYANGRAGHLGESDDESDYDDNDDDDEYDDDGIRIHNKSEGRRDRHRGKFSNDDENMSQTNTQSSILAELPNFNRVAGMDRHQPTPSNVAYAHSRF